jgi:hypothetical protein
VFSSLGSGAIWIAAGLLGVVCAVSVLQAGMNAVRALLDRATHRGAERVKQRLVIMLLHVAQPAVRLAGRLRFGLTPWRRRSHKRFSIPRRRTLAIWSERWVSPQQWLCWLQDATRDHGGLAFSGGEFDRWDIEVRGGLLGSMRVLMAIEEHGQGRQLVRCRVWPRIVPLGWIVVAVVVAMAIAAGFQDYWGACIMLAAAGVVTAVRAVCDCAYAAGTVFEVVESTRTRP